MPIPPRYKESRNTKMIDSIAAITRGKDMLLAGDIGGTPVR
jgi:hypothetical protein